MEVLNKQIEVKRKDQADKDILLKIIYTLDKQESIAISSLIKGTSFTEKHVEDLLTSMIITNPTLGNFYGDRGVFTRYDPQTQLDVPNEVIERIQVIIENRLCCKTAGRFGDKYCNTCGKVIPQSWIVS